MAVSQRVYAEALLEAAGEKGRLAEVREELADFVAAVRSSEELRGLLRNPQIEPHVKRDALEGALGDADELVRNFLLLVAEKGRIAEIEEASGRRVEATRRVDPSIIGGIVVQAGSQRLDASVRGRLNQLRQELTARR